MWPVSLFIDLPTAGRFAPCVATIFLLGLWSTSASAQDYGDWTVGSGQGYVEHSVGNGPGNTFTITCDFGATDNGANSNVSVTIADKRPAVGTAFYVHLDGKSYQFFEERSVGNLACRACRANFEGLWTQIKRSKQMLVTLTDGRSSPFSLKGVRQALKGKPCASGF